MSIDLHTHTTASDGALSPAALLARAHDNGVTTLAITDHDTVAAYSELGSEADFGLNLVCGIELSCRWAGIEVHIVGLNIDPRSGAVKCAASNQRLARTRRAEHIASKLRQAGFGDILESVIELAGGASIGRPHFAQHLVDMEYVKDTRQAFRKHLGGNKLGNLKQFWPELKQIVDWISGAGGTAVLAHPSHYKLTHTKLRALVEDFIGAGGTGIEVVSGRQIPTVTAQLRDLASSHKLLASCGSDFHRPGAHWADVGGCEPLPDVCRPVWDTW